MSKISKISGFPEWLPEQKLLEDSIIDRVRAAYAAHGFTPIETPAVELLGTLTAKGGNEKEIYALKRAQAEGDQESELGLHFDLTVPFARYVAQHYSELVFPFKRYQLQKVWRGERPQKGRFREFYQFDIDIIARDELPLACDSEVLTVIDRAFAAINVSPHILRVNNRKVLKGMYAALGLDAAAQAVAITAIDKLNKIGPDGVSAELSRTLGLAADKIARIMELTAVKFSPENAERELVGLGISNPLFEEGAAELRDVLALVPAGSRRNIEVDLSLARGLDYYTGTICEIYMRQFPDFGSVGSGGRYENLATEFIDRKLPGVGMSFGLSRLMDLIIKNNLMPAARKSCIDLLVTVYDEAQRPRCNEIADRARTAGLNVEVFYKSPKLGKQIDYADARGIPFVLFVRAETQELQVKDLRSKAQMTVDDLEAWCQVAKTSDPARI